MCVREDRIATVSGDLLKVLDSWSGSQRFQLGEDWCSLRLANINASVRWRPSRLLLDRTKLVEEPKQTAVKVPEEPLHPLRCGTGAGDAVRPAYG